MAKYHRCLSSTTPPRVPLLVVAATALLLAAQPIASAQESFRGTQADQQACTDDVFRLCNQFVPDEQRIIACLAQNRPSLSPGCKTVFSRPRPGDQDARR
jgi:hypothetical protein